MPASPRYRDPSLNETRARQRRTLRAIPDPFFGDWRPPVASDATTAAASRDPFVEIALRRAADEVAGKFDPFLPSVVDVAYADTATAAIQARSSPLSFEHVLAALAQTRLVAVDQLERLHFDNDDGKRWVHLVVWADALADDGYRDSRLD